MADDLGPILPEPGEEQTPDGDETSISTDLPAPEPAAPDDEDTTTTDAPPVDGLPMDDPLGAPGVGMDVPDQSDLPSE